MLTMERELIVYNEDQFMEAFKSYTEKIYIPAYFAVYIMHDCYEDNLVIRNNNIFKSIMGIYYYDYNIKFNTNNITLILKEA